MKILLTGGAGFIGSWVAEHLIADGHEVMVIDDLSTGMAENIPGEADFIECSILDRKKTRNAFEKFRPDILNHHAAQINVNRSVSDPLFDATVNIKGSLNLFELCRVYGTRKIIFASSGGTIYGDTGILPVKEETKCYPVSPYGIAKFSVEMYLKYYRSVHSIDFISLRYSNVYGERQNARGEAGVISIFCDNIINNRPCRVFGDGEQTRDFIYCKDVAIANLRSIHAPGGVYNIGSSCRISVNSIIAELKKLSGKEFSTKYEPVRYGEVRDICLDNSLAREQLGWTPSVDFGTGLENTWKWYLGRS